MEVEEEGEDDDCRERMIALCVIVALGALLAGMAIAFFFDWLDRTIL